MLKHLSATTLLGLALTHKVFASKFSLSLTTEELGGDSTELNEAKPLVVYIDKNSMSPEVLENLARTSNIVFADLPETPQFINLRELESMKDSTVGSLEELINEQTSDLNTDKNNEKFSQIEAVLQEIATECVGDEKNEQCKRGQQKSDDRDLEEDKTNKDDDEKKYFWEDIGDEDYHYEEDDEKYDEKYDKEYEDGEYDDDDYYEGDYEEDYDEEYGDEGPDEHYDEDYFEDEEEDEKEDCRKGCRKDKEKNDKKEEEDQDHYSKETEYEETFWGTEVSIGKTLKGPSSTVWTDHKPSEHMTYTTTSEKKSEITTTYIAKPKSITSSEENKTTSSKGRIFTSIKNQTRTSTEHETGTFTTYITGDRSSTSIGKTKVSSNKSHYKTSSGSSTPNPTITEWKDNKTSSLHTSYSKPTSRNQNRPSTGSKRESKSSDALLSPKWKAQANTSNITVGIGYDNSSSFLMPTTLLFAALLSALLFLQ